MYFTRNWEFGSALSKLQNFGVGVEPPPNTPVLGTPLVIIPYLLHPYKIDKYYVGTKYINDNSAVRNTLPLPTTFKFFC
jgi:hypothetical protein